MRKEGKGKEQSQTLRPDEKKLKEAFFFFFFEKKKGIGYFFFRLISKSLFFSRVCVCVWLRKHCSSIVFIRTCALEKEGKKRVLEKTRKEREKN